MGALYHLKQKLVDFCNVIQENVSRTDTVPSSKVVYDLKADSDSQISTINDSLNNGAQGYSKLPDGTLIQYGRAVFNATSVGVQEVTCNFQIPFYTQPNVCISWDDTNATTNNMDYVFAYTRSLTEFIARANRTNAGYTWYASWIAIGRWK